MNSSFNQNFNNEKIDPALALIATYVKNYSVSSNEAFETARICLADSLGCAILSLKHKACTKLLGPLIPGTTVPNGTRIPGTNYILDPIRAAFNLGTMIRWLDFNDTWLAAEWGHPSDNIGGILAIADFLSRQKTGKKFFIKDLLVAIIKAYEIQGELALLNSFNKIGLDHVILVKVATAAVVADLLGGSESQIVDAVSHAWIDTGPLRVYRHFPNTGPRKSWAAGDATSRGAFLAWIVMQGEMGYRQALTTKNWGFYDTLFNGKPFAFERPFTSYVMENILFKVKYPAEFHAQTAVECAIKLHPLVKKHYTYVTEIIIETQEAAMRIIDKKGPLKNPADRDHCLQYMVAIALLKGNLIAEDYEDEAALDPRIDDLRRKMKVIENPIFTKEYFDPDKRSIGNAITLHFSEGLPSSRLIIDYPLGHQKRRNEALIPLLDKFENNLLTLFSRQKANELRELFSTDERLMKMPVHTLIDQFLPS